MQQIETSQKGIGATGQILLKLLKILLLVVLIVFIIVRLLMRMNDVVVILNLPEDVNLGEIWMIQDQNCMTCGAGPKFVSSAQGRVKVRLSDPRWFVEIRVSPDSISHLHFLSNVQSGQVTSIDLSNTSVSDQDLQHINHLDLGYLNLNNTDISGEGFRYVSNPYDWLHVSVRDSKNLEIKNFAHFSGWNKVSFELLGSNLDNLTAQEEISHILCAGVEGYCNGMLYGRESVLVNSFGR